MSAFMVDDAHIDYLVTAVRAQRDRCRHVYLRSPERGTEIVDLSTYTDTELGRLLLGTNLRSMMARYEDRLEPGELNAPEAYRYRHWNGPQSAVQTIKACDCLTYQSCEFDEWGDSLAHAVVESLREAAIGSLPGMDAAAWEITRAGV